MDTIESLKQRLEDVQKFQRAIEAVASISVPIHHLPGFIPVGFYPDEWVHDGIEERGVITSDDNTWIRVFT